MLADPDRLYQALLDRDPSFDGQALVCVTSTGIYCRLTCPARKPKRENCQFRSSVAARSMSASDSRKGASPVRLSCSAR